MKLLIKLKNLFMSQKTKSKTSPKGGNRGCLCADETYSKECCNGDLQAQGIGATLAQGGESLINNVNEPRTIVRVSN
jgi:hypothetical protein